MSRWIERSMQVATVALLLFSAGYAWHRYAPAPAPTLPESAHAPPLSAHPVLAELAWTDWLRAYFASPVAAQGAPPASFGPIEASLDPAHCGACHAQQYADWRTSFHASAMGPGVMGQLVDWDGTQDALVGQCQRCHAPLAEQHPRLEGAANPDYLPETRAHGVSCAVCHVRQWTRYGPPAPVPENAPHGGFVGREEFQDPVFCSPCHDFEAGRTEREGKLLQETGPEWQRTPQAAAGQTCQTCHMPEGRHLWRGVHDPETVKQSVHVEADFSEQSGRLVGALRVQNVGAAHRLPTYTTPQLTLIVEQVDAAGAPLPDTRAEGAIARRLTPDLKTELFDTRLLPGEVHALDYDQPRAAGAVALVARLECWPDEAYRRFYEIKLRTPEKHPTGEAMLRAALQASIDSRFVVWEQVQPL